MVIYEISAKDGFRDLTVDDRHASDEEFDRLQVALRFTGRPLDGKRWEPPPLYSVYPRKLYPDVFYMNRGGLVVYSRAFDVLDMFLEMAGEVLTFKFDGLDLAICNITECVECIDEGRSGWTELPSGGRMCLRPHFDFTLLPESTLFKIPQWPTRIYCWERHKDPESEFKACYEKHKLKGISFRLVQSGEE